jgi:hypothetical protein
MGSPGGVASKGGHVDNLRWWLVLIAAVMFSMSGCASAQDWAYWREHPTHFASGDHLTFSMRNDSVYHPSVTEADRKLAQEHGWWGHLVPAAPPVDLSGRWTGTWKGLGLFDSLRQGTIDVTLVQRDHIGVAHLHMDNTIAAGVPWVIREEGSLGVRLVYRVAGNDAVMRDPAHPAEMTAAFTLVNDRLIGTLPSAESPVVITLVRQK